MPENFVLDPILTKKFSYNVNNTQACSNSSVTMNTELIHIIKLKYRKDCYTAIMSYLYEIKTTGINVGSYIEVSLAAH